MGTSGLRAKVRDIIQRGTHPLRMWIAESPSTRDCHLIWFQIRSRGLRKLFAGRHYDKGFFEEHVKLKPGYQKLADLLFAWAQPRSACDFGCGNGYLLDSLAQKGVKIAGIDASPEVLKFVPPKIRDRIQIRDLTVPLDLGEYEVVISTEVAEHLPKRAAKVFVGNLTRSARKGIVFTAAQPGQWGDGHINCQPRDFWIRLFEEMEWTYDKLATETFTAAIKTAPEIVDNLPWIIDNFMLFVPAARHEGFRSNKILA